MVKNRTLEIRFQFSGKGTTAVPSLGTYGPLISAISVESDFKPPSKVKKKIFIATGAGVSVLFITLAIISFSWWNRYIGGRISREKANLTPQICSFAELRGLDLRTGFFTYRQIKAATNNFDAANKIGEGGFGSVYKGTLLDDTIIAVKQLSSKSKQGNREFVNEIGMISGLQHPNLVKLYGCCIEKNQLLLVYEYMENNSLARALFVVIWTFLIHSLLVPQALVLQKKQSLMELVDPRLGSNFNKNEAEKMIRVALLCTSPSPALRPTMSEVVSMLQGDISIQEFNMDPSISDTELKRQALRETFDDLYLDSSETQALVSSSSTRKNDTSSRSVSDFNSQD
ncbi:hypothetical protein BUALT_BualtUnG0000300 [Buddleja alternifolia]|uniref:Protein kinase domain-containing protein n=1 Tax=Buddleja alternifolia TaxID=168488 RepID=A0AAV6W5R6_9LAMI|nr:hypothetical protein BUALT_BualtUnG0000300 [Buddleja alternifolia]